jgi:hypothetical protein
MAAIGLLPNLETARQERSVLLSDEQNLLLKEGKRSECIEHQNGFYELLTKPKSDLVWPRPDVPWMNLTV